MTDGVPTELCRVWCEWQRDSVPKLVRHIIYLIPCTHTDRSARHIGGEIVQRCRWTDASRREQ